jgi:hypothetical protein
MALIGKHHNNVFTPYNNKRLNGQITLTFYSLHTSQPIHHLQDKSIKTDGFYIVLQTIHYKIPQLIPL